MVLTRLAHAQDRIIHEVVRPPACLPPKLTVPGNHLDLQPVDDRIIRRATLQKGLVRINGDVNFPQPLVRARLLLACHWIPPPFTGIRDLVIEIFLKLPGHKVLLPQHFRTRLRVTILSVMALRTHGVIRAEPNANAFDLAFLIILP